MIGFVLSGDAKTASARLRGFNLIKNLPNAEVFDAGKLYRIVVFQKRYSESDLALAGELKSRGTKIVFDICDNYLADLVKRPNLLRMCGLANVVTTITSQMADVYRPYSKEVVVIEDGVAYVPQCKACGIGVLQELNVLWFGNHGERVGGSERGMGDLVNIRGALEDPRVNLRVVSNSYEKFSKLIRPLDVYSEYVEWQPGTIDLNFMQADVVVVPVVVDEFTVGKSANRILEAMLRGLPVIASPVPSYVSVIKNGHDGFIASGFSEFKPILESLIGDGLLRCRVGLNARLKVVKSYLIDHLSAQWQDLFMRLR